MLLERLTEKLTNDEAIELIDGYLMQKQQEKKELLSTKPNKPVAIWLKNMRLESNNYVTRYLAEKKTALLNNEIDTPFLVRNIRAHFGNI
ncbi:hypothetical protein BC6307_19340 [Sutcliffiella cohnii]|uniref:Uncharacterized protein n=1 Tax=Sutcliffiella cohnii TaxID=33932 RepID=A0A223KV62_9BACI|nr:hypothetical protein [Sutcliffiella cohnii]AST93257.1 hypothetical protein BC6307_19340 [Sutcliffiella cohnii]